MIFLVKFTKIFYKIKFMENKIKDLSQEFFTNFWTKIENIEVVKKEENIFLIKVQTPDSGKIIWPHGRNLDSVTQVLKLIILRNLENSEKIRIYLEINDYLKSKDDRLKDFIISKIKIVEKTWNDLKMPFFTAYERKKIHDIVADYGNPSVFTQSIWEGNERRIHICKAEKKLSIDIDSLEI